MVQFFKNAFKDMKESAIAQHKVDKANFAAAKAESKANFKKSVANSKRKSRIERVKKEQAEQIYAAREREKAAKKIIEDLDR